MLTPMAPKLTATNLTKIGDVTCEAIGEPISDVSGSCLKCANILHYLALAVRHESVPGVPFERVRPQRSGTSRVHSL